MTTGSAVPKRFTDTEKYKKQFMRSLPGAYKLFWDYLYHDCNHAGIWHVDFEVAQIYLGQDMIIHPETALRLFNETEQRIEVLANGKKWFIRTFIEFQYRVKPEQLNPASQVHASILASLLKEGLRVGDRVDHSLAPRLKDKYKAKDVTGVREGRPREGVAKKKLGKPTVQEIAAYAKEIGFGRLNAQHFYDYYESNGWRIGKNPMKNWQATVRTWRQKDQEANGYGADNSKSVTDFEALARTAREAEKARTQQPATGKVLTGE